MNQITYRATNLFRCSGVGLFTTALAFAFSASVLNSNFTDLPTGVCIFALLCGTSSAVCVYFFPISEVITTFGIACMAIYLVYLYLEFPLPAASSFVIASLSGLMWQRNQTIWSGLLFLTGLVGIIMIARPIAAIVSLCLLFVFTAIISEFCSRIIRETNEQLKPYSDQISKVFKPLFSFLLVYLLVGGIFGIIYHLLYIHGSKHFLISNNQVQNADLIMFTYWSITVLVTAGVGEIQPNSNVARSLSVIQIIFGVVWITIFFSFLSSKLSKKLD
jgi:hypothetical protein